MIVPAYNEAGGVRALLERVMAVPIPKEIVVVDGCSTDGTHEVLEDMQATTPETVENRSTSSSSATLPTALRVAEENLRLPPDIARFVLTIGATANQNGTALFEGVTVLFLAQFYAVDLTVAQQALVLTICIPGGIGTAGVPSGSLPVIAAILGTIGVPVEGLGLILGVDRFLDMCRTVVNVSGDLAAAVVVARGEAPSREGVGI